MENSMDLLMLSSWGSSSNPNVVQLHNIILERIGNFLY